jgi:hypothetical protein
LRIVVGDLDFGSNVKEKAIPGWANVGDEALAILLVENCWDQECDIHFDGKMTVDVYEKKNIEKARNGDPMLSAERKARPCKWSSGVKSTTGGGNVQGWSERGMIRFNELRYRTEVWRKSKEGEAFYREILDKHRNTGEGKKKRKRQYEVTITTGDDWSDDEDGERAAV